MRPYKDREQWKHMPYMARFFFKRIRQPGVPFPVSPVPDTDSSGGVSVLVLTYLMNMLTDSSQSVVQSLGTIVPELPAFIEITVLLIAPIGIFLFFIFIGDATNNPEIWIGAALTMLFSGIGAFYQVLTSGLPTVTTPFLLALFQWTAYLVQPASVIAAVVVLIGTEMFRRSVRYTLFRDMVRITGGIWTPVEHLIAYKQIGK